MNNKELIFNIEYLVNKYVPMRRDLIELISKDDDAVKYILAEVSRCKTKDYDNEDKELLKDISFFYI